MRKIYFIVPAPPGISPSQRFRHEHYLSKLRENNFHFKISSFYSFKSWKTLYTYGHKFEKILFVFYGLFRRLKDLFGLINYNFVYIHREAAPVGPPFFEWMIAKILRKKIIYDFDDAIWIPVTSEYNTAAAKFKWPGKVSKICKWSYKISVGNQFLLEFALKYNSRLYIIPTVLNTQSLKQQDQQTLKPAIGWTGSFSTLKYLDIVLPVLQELQKKHDFMFIVIADKDPQLPLTNYKFIQWRKETEVNDLLNFHIGIMPLYDDDLSKGKCGFKAIQYMSIGIPAVVSPVGVNADIVDEGVNGFLCSNENDWKAKLEKLLTDPLLRTAFGHSAKEKINNKYSVQATEQKFLNLFN